MPHLENRCYASINVKELRQIAAEQTREGDHQIMSQLFYISQNLCQMFLSCDYISFTDGQLFVNVQPGLLPTGDDGKSFMRDKNTRADWNNLYFEEGLQPRSDYKITDIAIITASKDLTDFILKARTISDINGKPYSTIPHIGCIDNHKLYGPRNISIYTHSDSPAVDFNFTALSSPLPR